MSRIEVRSFAEFWPYYVGAHRTPVCRALHYVGTSLGIASGLYGLATLSLGYIALAPVLGYGLAWIGHFGFERNKPAAFGNPWWSFLGDMRMLRLGLTGRMADEVTRLYGSAHPAPDAPLLTDAPAGS